MSNSKRSTPRNKSHAEDAKADKQGASRLNRTHGGELVHAISPEEIVPMNDPDCPHEKMVRDKTETEWNVFMCTNCPVVAVLAKK